jgi:hypothetical protein
MPGMTFTLSEYPFDWIELACDRCNRRGRLRKAGLVKVHGAECGVARLRELLIRDCPRYGNWHDPCRAYYVGLNEWWAEQPRNPPAAPTQRGVSHAAKSTGSLLVRVSLSRKAAQGY